MQARIDAQDERIALLWQHVHDHHERIRKAVEDAAKASRVAAAAFELLRQVLDHDDKEGKATP